ncbi:MAG: MoaD/ThiS family protein [Methanobacteriota archaeon]|nr:MAG: MoaD/ThiS family protein [Euryarchaeota archaeon]
MRVTAELFPARETRTVDLSEDADGYELMKRLGLAPDVHILVRDEVPIPIDERLRAGERLRVIAVVSGG